MGATTVTTGLSHDFGELIALSPHEVAGRIPGNRISRIGTWAKQSVARCRVWGNLEEFTWPKACSVSIRQP